MCSFLSSFLRPVLTVLAVSLVLAGCDSGSDEADGLGNNTTFSFASSGGGVVPEDSTDEDGNAAVYEMTVVVNDPGYEARTVELAFDEDASGVSFDEVEGIDRVTEVAFEERATDGDTQTFSFSVVDDGEAGETDEDVVFVLQNPQPGSIGESGTFTLTVEDDDEDFGVVSIAEAREIEPGTSVAVEGVFTRIEGSNARIQDESGATGASGLVVRAGAIADAVADGSLEPGDRIRASGELGAFNGLLQINSNVSFEVIEENAGLPNAQSVALTDLQAPGGEDYVSELVNVEGLQFADEEAGGTFEGGANYTIRDDAGNELALRIPSGSYYEEEAIPSGSFTFEGVLGQFNNSDDPNVNEGYQLLVILDGDVEDTGDAGGNDPQVILFEDFQDGPDDDEGELGQFTAFSVDGDGTTWGPGTDGSAPTLPYAIANNLSGGEPANDWLISPALDLDAYENEQLSFLNAKGYDDEGLDDPALQVLVSNNYDGSDNPEDFDWTDVTDQATLATVADQTDGPFSPFIESGVVDLSDFEGDAVYVAFRYTSSGTGAGASEAQEIDNVLIEEEGADREGFPNPPGRPSSN